VLDILDTFKSNILSRSSSFVDGFARVISPLALIDNSHQTLASFHALNHTKTIDQYTSAHPISHEMRICLYLLSFAVAGYAVAPSRLYDANPDTYYIYSNIRDVVNPTTGVVKLKGSAIARNAAIELKKQKERDEVELALQREGEEEELIARAHWELEQYYSQQEPGSKTVHLKELHSILDNNLAIIRHISAEPLTDKSERGVKPVEDDHIIDGKEAPREHSGGFVQT